MGDTGAVAPRELRVASCKMASMQNAVRSPTQLLVVRPHPLRLIWKGLQITRFRLHGSGIFIEVGIRVTTVAHIMLALFARPTASFIAATTMDITLNAMRIIGTALGGVRCILFS